MGNGHLNLFLAFMDPHQFKAMLPFVHFCCGQLTLWLLVIMLQLLSLCCCFYCCVMAFVVVLSLCYSFYLCVVAFVVVLRLLLLCHCFCCVVALVLVWDISATVAEAYFQSSTYSTLIHYSVCSIEISTKYFYWFYVALSLSYKIIYQWMHHRQRRFHHLSYNFSVWRCILLYTIKSVCNVSNSFKDYGERLSCPSYSRDHRAKCFTSHPKRNSKLSIL